VGDWNLDALRADPVSALGWHVRANMVSSVDGAGWFDGRSGPLSGAADVDLFRALRAVADVVLVGAGTVRVENYGPLTLSEPLVEWRRSRGLSPYPRLAVISGRLALQARSRLFEPPPEGGSPVLLLTAGAAPPHTQRTLAAHADIETLTDLAPATIASALHARGLSRIHLEGGPSTLGDFVVADLLDELRLTLSPLLAGGTTAITPHGAGTGAGTGAGGRIVTGPSLRTPRRLTLESVTQVDGFLFLSYARARG
jgi:riboflavin biosynthesis pyrimidine reductase